MRRSRRPVPATPEALAELRERLAAARAAARKVRCASTRGCDREAVADRFLCAELDRRAEALRGG